MEAKRPFRSDSTCSGPGRRVFTKGREWQRMEVDRRRIKSEDRMTERLNIGHEGMEGSRMTPRFLE